MVICWWDFWCASLDCLQGGCVRFVYFEFICVVCRALDAVCGLGCLRFVLGFNVFGLRLIPCWVVFLLRVGF